MIHGGLLVIGQLLKQSPKATNPLAKYVETKQIFREIQQKHVCAAVSCALCTLAMPPRHSMCLACPPLAAGAQQGADSRRGGDAVSYVGQVRRAIRH